MTEVTRRTRIIRRIIIDEFGNEKVYEEEVPIEEIENPMEEDDEDQMVVVGAASDEGPGSPRVEPLRFETRQVRSAHFEYKSDEEEREDEKEESIPVVVSEIVPYPETASQPETIPELSNQLRTEKEVSSVPIVSDRGSLKRIALRHEDEVASKRQVCYCYQFLSAYQSL